jgi:glycosyltransferase involved in cell wall biosynthesis
LNKWPYRVLQVMAGAPVGGIETFFFDAVLALADAGLEQTAIVRPNTPYQTSRLSTAGVPCLTTGFNPWFILPSRRTIASEIRRFRPDIVQYWTGRAAMTAVETDAHQVGWFGGYLQRRRYKTCTHFIGITKDLVRHIRDQGVPEKNISLVHTFAERSDAAPLDRKQFDTPVGAPLLLALARLHRHKGLDVLLKAMARTSGLYLWIAGEGPERSALVKQSESLGLSDRVRFLGWRTDRDALLATADVCVIPSREESFGTVMIEAWAAGVPLVAAAAPGPAAYIDDGRSGLLVPINDPDALARAIERVVSDSKLRDILISNGQNDFKRQFTKQSYVRSMREVYSNVTA